MLSSINRSCRILQKGFNNSVRSMFCRGFAGKSDQKLAHPTPLSIEQLQHYAESQDNMPVRLALAQFISTELPIRFAATTSTLSALPCQLSEMPATNDLISLYNQCEGKITNMAIPKTIVEDTEFTANLGRVQRDLQHVYPLMACGVCQLKDKRENRERNPLTDFENEMINIALDDFVSLHISIIMLLGQYVKSLARPGGRIQNIDYPVIQNAIDRSTKLTEKFYGQAPPVKILFATKMRPFDYIPSHMHHMIFEIMKNSMRATMKKMKEEGESEPDPINVIISHGENDITISDMGGGMTRPEMSQAWNYTFTSAAPPPWVDRYFRYYDETEHDLYLNNHINFDKYEFMGGGKENKFYTHSATHAIRNNTIDRENGHIDDLLSYSPVMRDHYAGLGYGLPVSRIYSRYFGGDMKLFSMEGYGTDVYLYLSSLSNELEQFTTSF